MWTLRACRGGAAMLVPDGPDAPEEARMRILISESLQARPVWLFSVGMSAALPAGSAAAPVPARIGPWHRP